MMLIKNVARCGLLLAFAALPMTSCTAKYQDMLRDRDETIRDLESKLSTSRRENSDLRRDLAAAKSDLAAARAQPAVVAADTTPKQDPLDNLKSDLENAGLGKDKVNARYRNGRLSIGIANRVTFASGSTRISPEGESVLKRLARVLKTRFADKRIYIEGHTDTDPIRKTRKKYRSNRHLSVERADAVASFLTSKAGLPDQRVVIMGFGPYDPVAPGDKAQNRRVEIVVAD